MTTTLERPPAPPVPVRSSRWAWVATLSSPVLAALAVWMAFFVLGDENIKWWGDVIVTVLMAGPPVVGIVLGVHSAKSGNRLGAHATALAAGWIGLVITFWYAANYPYNGESNVMPVSLGVAAAVVVAAAVETWYWAARRRLRDI